MTMKKIISALLLVALLFTLCACSSNPAENKPAEKNEAKQAAETTETADKPVTLRFSITDSAAAMEANETGLSVGLNTWIKTVEEESNGSITVETFPDGMLATGADAIINGIQTGAFDVAHFVTGSWSEYTNAFAELNVPYLFRGYDEAYAVIDGQIGQDMFTRLQNDVKGIVPLSYLALGFRNITATKEIHSVDDMRGLKIRTMSDPLQIAAMTAMGAQVTSVNISELYSALQTHMVDAQENPLSNIYSLKYHEVTPYCCLSQHSFTTSIIFMSDDAYNKLSDNQKAAVTKANVAAQAASRAASEKSETAMKDQLSELGMKFYTPTEEEAAAFQSTASSSWSQAQELMGDERYNALLKAAGVEQ